MGYNFLMLDLPASVAAKRAEYHRTIEKQRPGREVADAFFDAAEGYSFHLNIAGMAFCRRTMSDLGMLADGELEPFPLYPKWDQSLYQTASDHRAANPDVWAEYEAAEHRAMVQTGVGPEIARFKFMSNGPWIVTGDEVAASLARYNALSQDRQFELETDDIWRQWIGWLRRAPSGFEVG